MPSAIVTVRKLKNKETGIDINIPVYKEIKGLLHSSWEFYVVVVSNLQYFKSPKHKDTDVVQFMVQKRFADFESLHAKLTEKYPSTILPALPKKTLITTENAVKERKFGLEKFLQFIAVTNKLVNCSVFLEFLGVNAIKAGKFRTDVEETNDAEQKETDTPVLKNDNTEEEQTRNLFGDSKEEDDDESDLFITDTLPEDIDFSPSTYFQEDTKLFENQDLRGSIEEGNEEELFIPGSNIPSIITKTVREPDEDNSDLLQIEDDLSSFLTVEDQQKDTEERVKLKPKPTPRQKPITSDKPSISPKPGNSNKPSLPAKPTVKTVKPEVNMPETSTADDDRVPSNKSSNEVESNTKPTKSSTQSKPPIPKKPNKQSNIEEGKLPVKSDKSGQSSDVQSLETNDILQYIEANTEKDEEIDLFS